MHARKQERHRQEGRRLESSQLARQIVEIASDKLATDIVLLDIHALTSIADYFVICTAGSSRQISAITDALFDTLTEAGVKPLHSEGIGESGWVLVDFGDVIVHIFTEAERDYYSLEQLWNAAPVVLRMQ